jgi:hypothetical protein
MKRIILEKSINNPKEFSKENKIFDNFLYADTPKNDSSKKFSINVRGLDD